MAAARYWRLARMETFGYRADLELVELRLFAGSVDVTGVPSAPVVPAAGSLADLGDGVSGALGTVCRFHGEDVALPGFALVWDLGAAVEVTELRLGSAQVPSCFVYAMDVDYSTDGLVWTNGVRHSGIAWPGEWGVFSAPTSAPVTPVARVVAVGGPPPIVITDYNPPGATKVAVGAPVVALDVVDAGLFRVAGTVAEKGVPTNLPLRRKVRLFNERDGRFIRETWSDATTGAYVFNEVRGDVTYTVVSYDYTNMYRAVIADNLTATPMP